MNGHPANLYMDFLNTATFGISVDPGVTYTSQSGLLGSDITPAAVPEPATWAMLILGFGAVGATARRRRMVVA
ncbi:MAG: PEPxxWA-CTERM sorting domain-containing protein [Alphaproteobacteria bacterium]|nr:PEPxxWA-CTERM sorting domain-containing protein [Alphaproteobacteria bacterium]MBU1515769.1 PEPxxWA-CTERM sorting domain-containing protein [Alphaproteobacteria bacterium]MBU2097052.1 PEPxxWA-CTERM sorting domain-containing protein [Alphaproteobacteria bacterium]MBU2149568.1 PEPxxWA-CTERM sorting domain-containing protein [Alphaproteobacteria bacterium]MBU2308954.1 PEPxxWA-CTERM sorting domain-containing protein [Alphaproteobacteria bacterium]